MSPCKSTSVSTGKKPKQKVFCLNLVDSIAKHLQILKGKLKLLYCLCIDFHLSPQNCRKLFMDSVFDMKMCSFSQTERIWYQELLESVGTCSSRVVLQVAICGVTTRCHRSRTLDCNEHALSLRFFFFLFLFSFYQKLSYIICYESILGRIQHFRCNIL